MTHINDSKFLSALALFQEYYRSYKGDVHQIILQFIYAVVDDSHLNTFSVNKIDELLHVRFNIEIPSATIRMCLLEDKSMFGYKNGEFILKGNISIQESIKENFDSYCSTCEDVIAEIKNNIEKRELVTLNKSEEEELRTLVYDYIVDEGNGVASSKYSPYIMEYFVKNEDDQTFCDAMNAAKEGLIIYKGLQYNTQTDGATWRTPTTFYLDMEYLFWAYGFNEEYDRQYFMDFYNLVTEINDGTPKHNGQPLIKLRYFKETKEEIDKYFQGAVLIKQHKRLPNLNSPAMCKICNECKDEVDVLKYKSKFYSFINRLGIVVENTTIDVTQHTDKLFETQELMDKLRQTFQGEELEEAISLIKIADYIAILRGKYIQNTKIENCGYIFLSNTNITNRVSKILHCLDPNAKLFLFTRMGLFTDLLWLKAKKGLIVNKTMPSFDIVGRAKNIMSTLIHTKVCDAYDCLQSEGYTKEEMVEMYSTFREYDYRPESINSSNVEENVEFIISNIDYSRYKERQSALQKKANDGEAAIKAYNKLKSEKAEIEEELVQLKKDQYVQEMHVKSKLYKIARIFYTPAYYLYAYYRLWIGLIALIAICISGYISYVKGAPTISILSAAISIVIAYISNINKIRQFVRHWMLHRYKCYYNYIIRAYTSNLLLVKILIQIV